jgi:hypothetical protein
MLTYKISIVLIFMLLSITHAIKLYDIPIPKNDMWVSDKFNYLQNKDKINDQLNINSKLKSKSFPCDTNVTRKPYNIGLAVIDTIEGFSSHYPNSYANNLFDIWSLNDNECNNGILILISMKDKTLVITSKIHSDILSVDNKQKVIEIIKHHIRDNNNTDDAVLNGINELTNYLHKNKPQTSTKTQTKTTIYVFLFFGLSGIVFTIFTKSYNAYNADTYNMHSRKTTRHIYKNTPTSTKNIWEGRLRNRNIKK